MDTDAQPTALADDAAGEEVKDLRERLVLFAIVLASIAIDLAFLIGWMFAIRVADFLFSKIIHPEGAGKVLRIVSECMFDASTLAVLGVYLVRDVTRSARRIWRQP